MRPPRILIVNTVALNAGDAAILLGAVRSLRDAFGGQVDIVVADDDPEAAARLYPELRFVPGLHVHRPARGPRVLRRLSKSVRRRRIALAVRLLGAAPRLAEWLLDAPAREHLARIRAADAVVTTGGTYLVEHYNVRIRVHELLAAQALGRPTFLYTQSLGPFRQRRNRRVVARALGAAAGIFVRDERSRRHLADVGIPEARVAMCADAAFALADASNGEDTPPPRATGPHATDSGATAPAALAPGAKTRAARSGDRSPLHVAVSVREWAHFRTRSAAEGREAYRRAVADAVRHLVARGAEITFVSTCQGVPEYRTDDARYARALVDELLPDLPGVRVDAAFRRPEELMAFLRSFDLAVATRMHFAILSLAAGVPVVPIAYEFKTAELFAGLGLDDLVEDIETITSAGLRGRIGGALASRDELRARIARAVEALRRDAAAPAVAIREHLAAAPSPAAPVPAGERG